MLDVSRHYYHPKDIKRIITAMSLMKLNVLHIHLTDDESFPYYGNAMKTENIEFDTYKHEYLGTKYLITE